MKTGKDTIKTANQKDRQRAKEDKEQNRYINKDRGTEEEKEKKREETERRI